MLNICFHGVGTPKRALEPGEDIYWVDVERFNTILDEVATWPSTRLSFDDSNASDIEIALPALLKRNLRADFFVIAGRLGLPGSLSEADVVELRQHGMGIGSHGMSHVSWRRMDAPTRHAEMVAAREILSTVLGAPVDEAACPRGQYDRGALKALRHNGYTRVFTSDRRPANPSSWLQPRYSVRSHDTAESMRAEVLPGPGLAGMVRGSAVGLVKRWR
jgi:peptidoglycan/xylan/chitin deacetylase (PgdA/CDA1 family)